MDFLFELLFQLVGEVLLELIGQAVFEALFEVFGRSAKATQAELLGHGEKSWTWRIVAYFFLVVIAFSFGSWRGTVAAGTPTFGLWTALGVAVFCCVGYFALPRATDEPPANVWVRVFRWWPRRRLVWFATGNAVFALGYLGAL